MNWHYTIASPRSTIVKTALQPGLCLLLLASPSAVPQGEPGVYASHLMVDQEVVVASRIGGIVETIVVDRGSSVTQGQTLATLDPRELDANVKEAKEEMELSRVVFERSKSLAASKVVSTADLDEKKSQFEVAQARWEKAKTTRDYTVIRAPFAGIVTEKWARVGQKVIEDKGEPLFKITAVEPLLARIYLPEEELLRVKVGAKVEVVPDHFPDARTTGEVQFISPAVDAASGTFQVVIRVRRDVARAVLRPGIAVRVRFAKAEPR
jgi:membrane fusion protein (multidrug efflux system)